MSQTSSGKMTFWGASPEVFKWSLVYSAAVIVVQCLWSERFTMGVLSQKTATILALALLAVGFPLYVVTVRIIRQAFGQDRLMTSGVFAVCRNPLFAEVMFLLLPAIFLFFRSWLLFTILLFIYIMFRLFIPREEALLLEKFGEEYARYKARTTALFPCVWRFRRRD